MGKGIEEKENDREGEWKESWNRLSREVVGSNE